MTTGTQAILSIPIIFQTSSNKVKGHRVIYFMIAPYRKHTGTTVREAVTRFGIQVLDFQPVSLIQIKTNIKGIGIPVATVRAKQLPYEPSWD